MKTKYKKKDTKVLVDLLSLVSCSVSEGFLNTLTQAQRDEADKWAWREHMVASDHRELKRLQRPAFLPKG